MKQKISEIIKSKTDFQSILKYSILFFGLSVIIIFFQVFIFWGIYGEGAESTRIAEIWYVDYIMELLPAIIVIALIIYKILKSYNYSLTKTYLTTLIIFVLLYVFRIPIIDFFIELFQ